MASASTAFLVDEPRGKKFFDQDLFKNADLGTKKTLLDTQMKRFVVTASNQAKLKNDKIIFNPSDESTYVMDNSQVWKNEWRSYRTEMDSIIDNLNRNPSNRIDSKENEEDEDDDQSSGRNKRMQGKLKDLTSNKRMDDVVGDEKEYEWSNVLFGKNQLVKEQDLKKQVSNNLIVMMRTYVNTKYPAMSYQRIINTCFRKLGFKATLQIIAIALNGVISNSGNTGRKEAVRQEELDVLDPKDRTRTTRLTMANVLLRNSDFSFYNSAMTAKKSKDPDAVSTSRIMIAFASPYLGMALYGGIWNTEQFNIGLIGPACTTFISSAHCGPATRLCNILHAIEFNNNLKQGVLNQRAEPAWNLIGIAWAASVDAILPTFDSFPEVHCMLLTIELYSTIWLIQNDAKCRDALKILNELAVLGRGIYYDWLRSNPTDKTFGKSCGSINHALILEQYNSISKYFYLKNDSNNMNVENYVPDQQTLEYFNSIKCKKLLGDVVKNYKINKLDLYNSFSSTTRNATQTLVAEGFKSFCMECGFDVSKYVVLESNLNALESIENENARRQQGGQDVL